MHIRACIFDLDGVIVDTAKYHFMAWKRLADQLNIRFTKKDNERLKGVSRYDSLEIILELGKLKLNQIEKDVYASLKNKWYIDYINKMTPKEILPGSLQLIDELKKAGIKVAIGSASKNTPVILKRIGMSKLFDAVADGNVVSKAKPDPEVFLTAAKMLNVEPEYCIVFEDAIAGVRAAVNAGMRCIGIGSAKILTEADSVISGLNKINLKELEKLYGNERML
jgi:beta-phosphoglucomutase